MNMDIIGSLGFIGLLDSNGLLDFTGNHGTKTWRIVWRVW